MQKKRVESNSILSNGNGGLKLEPHDDSVPKELMRHFAVATADLNNTADISDLARGLEEISRFASVAADWTPEMAAFKSWLACAT